MYYLGEGKDPKGDLCAGSKGYPEEISLGAYLALRRYAGLHASDVGVSFLVHRNAVQSYCFGISPSLRHSAVLYYTLTMFDKPSKHIVKQTLIFANTHLTRI